MHSIFSHVPSFTRNINMEFKTLEPEARKLLLKALDIDINTLKCAFCNEKLTHINCSILPSLNNITDATITCGSPLCISEYLCESEITRCTECEEEKPIGKKTKQCLECLDWKMDDLNK